MLDEAFDAVGARVEGPGELGDLVAALDRRPRVEVALAESVDVLLQRLETAREAAGDGIGRDRHGEAKEGR